MNAEAGDPRAGILAALARLDVAGAQARGALEAADIESVLLKGRAFAQRLYDHVWERPYADTDVLVGLGDRAEAEGVLAGLGYARIDRDGDRLGAVGYAHTFMRPDGGSIDLHWGISGVTAEPLRVWETISAHTVSLTVGGHPARVPDDPLTALLVVLHAAHHGGQHGLTMTDLEHAITRIGARDWGRARDLALALGAGEAFASGLALSPAGRELAQRLGTPASPTLEYRLRAEQTEFRVWALHRLAGARGLTRVRVIAEVLVPPPGAMRRFEPLARRGRRGLLAAYLLRAPRLLLTAVPALADYLRARRAL